MLVFMLLDIIYFKDYDWISVFLKFHKILDSSLKHNDVEILNEFLKL